jgi:hypothetical protein
MSLLPSGTLKTLDSSGSGSGSVHSSKKARHVRTASFGADGGGGSGGKSHGGGGGGGTPVDRGVLGPAAFAKTTPLQSAFNLMNSITGNFWYRV